MKSTAINIYQVVVMRSHRKAQNEPMRQLTAENEKIEVAVCLCSTMTLTPGVMDWRPGDETHIAWGRRTEFRQDATQE